jgi:hypothetical protein
MSSRARPGLDPAPHCQFAVGGMIDAGSFNASSPHASVALKMSSVGRGDEGRNRDSPSEAGSNESFSSWFPSPVLRTPSPHAAQDSVRTGKGRGGQRCVADAVAVGGSSTSFTDAEFPQVCTPPSAEEPKADNFMSRMQHRVIRTSGQAGEILIDTFNCGRVTPGADMRASRNVLQTTGEAATYELRCRRAAEDV